MASGLQFDPSASTNIAQSTTINCRPRPFSSAGTITLASGGVVTGNGTTFSPLMIGGTFSCNGLNRNNYSGC
jgi:hypothetical protein